MQNANEHFVTCFTDLKVIFCVYILWLCVYVKELKMAIRIGTSYLWQDVFNYVFEVWILLAYINKTVNKFPQI